MKYPLKLSWKTEIVPLLLVAAAVIFGFYFYAHLPERVISHWNFAGQPDGYSGRFTGAFALPIMLAVIYLLFLFIPRFDPKAERYESFAKPYAVLRSAILAVLFIIFLAASYANLGYNIKIGTVVPVVIGLLMIVIGNFMGKLKNNWFVGIRNPWTLSSENVWNKTHRVGGWLFVVFGLLLILTPFLNQTVGLIAFIIGILLVVLGTNVYSYFVFRAEHKNG